MIEIEGIVYIEIVDCSQRIPLHTVFVEQTDTPHHLVEGGLPCYRTAIFVMKLLRTVDGDPDKEIVFSEKPAPFVGQQCGIRLYAIVNLASLGIFPLKHKCAPIECHRTHQRFPSMPGEEYLRSGLGLNVFLDKLFKQTVGDDVLPAIGIQFFLLQIVTVLATQVAERPRRLQHHIHRTGKGETGIHFLAVIMGGGIGMEENRACVRPKRRP